MLASFISLMSLVSLPFMEEAVLIADVIAHWDRWQIIDVRSPGEFIAGHIPGAVNIPLFTDEERAKVGTLYKQDSPDVAFREGLEIAGAKMTHLIDAVQPYRKIPEKDILIHCWRGGKRSKAIQWLFNFSGVPAYRLEGGYKLFRAALQSFFEGNTFELKILGGCTGAGKTEVLEELAKKGEQVIDLEKLAHHKGSAFGSIGEEEQPSTEQYANILFIAFLALNPAKPVWLENESKSIGRVYLPEGLWEQMRKSMLYTIDVDREVRLNRAIKYYCEPVNIELLKASFDKIHKRLGGLNYQQAIKALEANDLKTAADIALAYYDKSYTFQLGNWPADKVIRLEGCNDVATTASRLLHL